MVNMLDKVLTLAPSALQLAEHHHGLPTGRTRYTQFVVVGAYTL
jgi:hypothetical protein